MKNSRLWFVGLLAVILIGMFFAIPINDTSISNTEVSEKETNAIKNSESKIESKTELDNLDLAGTSQIRLQVTMAQVSPDGSSIFGGVGPPGQTVLLFNGDKIIAEAIINNLGDWIAIPEKPLEAGSHFIQLGIKPSPGENELSRLSIKVVSKKEEQSSPKLDNLDKLPLTPESKNSSTSPQILNSDISDLAVVVDIEEDKEEKPLVVFVPKSDASIPIVVQSPEILDKKLDTKGSEIETDIDRLWSVASVLDTADSISNSIDEAEFIQIRSLSWEEKSKLRLSGFASGGQKMRAYFDEQFIASISLNNSVSDIKTRRWSMVAEASMQANRKHSLRAELLDANDLVIKVSELTISAESLEIGKDGSDMMVIHKGDALWRIAYKTYGKGIRYVDIFKRNNTRISDPDLIFPDQIFAIPD